MDAGRFEFPDTAGYRCRMLEGGALKPNIRHPFHEAFLPHRSGSSATFTKIKPVASLVHDVEFSLLDFGFEELPIELDTAMGWRDRVICRIPSSAAGRLLRALLHPELSRPAPPDGRTGIEASLPLPAHAPYQPCRRLQSDAREVIRNGRHVQAPPQGQHRVHLMAST